MCLALQALPVTSVACVQRYLCPALPLSSLTSVTYEQRFRRPALLTLTMFSITLITHAKRYPHYLWPTLLALLVSSVTDDQ